MKALNGPTGASARPRVSVVIPVYNEVRNVGPLADEIRTALDGRERYEVVFVDDRSEDGTFALLTDLAAERPEMTVVRHPRKR